MVDDERNCCRRMVLGDNDTGQYEKKYLIHAKRWGVYIRYNNN